MGVSTSFVEPDLLNPSVSEIIDIDTLLSNAHELLGGIPDHNASELPTSVPEQPRTNLPDLGHNVSAAQRTWLADDEACASALANIAKRFVKAFFEHIATHIPIVHKPNFDIATVPSPLLLAMMACGAVYLSEHSVAVSMHAVAMQLILEHERTAVPWMTDNESQTWTLQTYLLLSYFAVYCGDEEHVTQTFPHSVKLVQEALGDLKTRPITTYKDWVRQESTNRCIASTILLGASIASNERKVLVPSPVLEIGFALPSTTADWLKDEASWEAPAQALYGDDALKSILAGQAPDLPVSEFGLVTIVSVILYRVCAFETLIEPHHLELYTSFGEQMGGAVRILDEILKRRLSEKTLDLEAESVTQCAKSLLNSVFYHLYGSIPLATMKKLLSSPTTLDSPVEISNLLVETCSPVLYKALIRAADQLRFDCRVGLKYIRKTAPLRFGPECAISIYEGNLLLCWYLQFAHSHLPPGESRNVLTTLIDEGFAEVEDLRVELQGQRVNLPLAICLELLSDSSVWKWPSTVSQRLGFLIKRLQAMGQMYRL
ncbi:hypothetical protein CNMCM5623_005645 [Aspergillus felis]|uniref:Xylanolytic transcriptional activator regulatory domain-containing protein n=1 Tax=Aspergillus felis TaxID=1287682 RepID=A0A8H6QJM4_9EURO|nr:hypothetical protein CNMCM5623_005645 [Aspergillus felis]